MKKKVLKTKAKSGRRDSGNAGRGSLFARLWPQLFLGASLTACGSQLHAAEADAAKEETKEEEKELTPEQMFEGGEEVLSNWVELSYGGMLTSDSKGAAQQRLRLGDGMFGGIEDLHYQKQVNKETLFTTDVRALPGQEDYALRLSIAREKLGFVKFRFEQFRTWYNGNGGYFEPADLSLRPQDDTLFVDRGEVGFVAGLTLKDAPQLTFEYIHQYRNGEKGSTSWAPVNLGAHSAQFSGTRGIGPAFWDIDEQRDIFKLDLQHQIKKTELGAGVRYETSSNDNARKILFRPTEPTQRYLTHREGSSDDLFSAHAWSETWFKPNLMVSSGFLFANLNGSFTGSRIYGDDFDVINTPSAANGAGFVDMDGLLHQKEYVLNLNLMTIPVKDLTIVPSVRFQLEDWDSESWATPTSGAAGAGTPVFSESNGDSIDIQERLDIRYSGVTNWVFYTRGEWSQGTGELNENGSIGQTIDRQTDNERLFQKYTVGARWYPSRSVTFDVGGYYKRNAYDYDHDDDNTGNTSSSRYPAYLLTQNFSTWDGNIRATWRPINRLTLGGRYEYQLASIDTTPDAPAGQGAEQTSVMTRHILGGNASWVPMSRLSLQLGANYVMSETETEGENLDFTRAVLSAQNNYWTLNFNTTVVLDNKTDLNLGYFHYESNNGRRGLVDGLSLGAESAEHGVTALVTRRLSENLRLKMRYTWFTSEDNAFGSQNDFDAHVLFTSLQYRF